MSKEQLTKDDVAAIVADILNRIAKHTKASGRTEISADDVEAVVRDVILNGL